MKNKRGWFLTLIFLGAAIAIFSQCLNLNSTPDPRGEAYAGSGKCIRCHQDIYKSYLQTAHYYSSRSANVHTIHGSFAEEHNVVNFNDGTKVRMEKKGNEFSQSLYVNGKKSKTERFDIVFGGVKAETYAYWKDNELFQLPVSYFTTLNGWANSPGYTAGRAFFGRPIIQRCLECHSSYISELPRQGISDQKIEFDKASLMYGVDCERCHGPAAEHVNFQTAHPEEKQAKYIVTNKSLTRQQRLDACAVCHSGNKEDMTESTFNFKPGDSYKKFKSPSFSRPDNNPATLDVHGNQNGLLASSKCFLMSNMDCGTCHDTHKNAAANLAIYAQKCMNCHNDANHNFCKLTTATNTALKTNCIACHMPLKPSDIIKVNAAGHKKEAPYFVRTHYIAIYPDESKRILGFINKLKNNSSGNLPVN